MSHYIHPLSVCAITAVVGPVTGLSLQWWLIFGRTSYGEDVQICCTNGDGISGGGIWRGFHTTEGYNEQQWFLTTQKREADKIFQDMAQAALSM